MRPWPSAVVLAKMECTAQSWALGRWTPLRAPGTPACVSEPSSGRRMYPSFRAHSVVARARPARAGKTFSLARGTPAIIILTRCQTWKTSGEFRPLSRCLGCGCQMLRCLRNRRSLIVGGVHRHRWYDAITDCVPGQMGGQCPPCPRTVVLC